MKHLFGIFFAIIFLFLTLPEQITAQSLTIYSGRSKALVEPIVDRFEEETGINAQIRYGSSTQLAVALMEEGNRSPADVFWAQDAGALGAVYKEGLLEELPGEILELVPDQFQSSSGTWVATSGRARVLAYSIPRVDENELPSSVFSLTDSEWQDRVGWAPENASFQAFLTALRTTEGEDTARQWLQQMKDNGAKSYSNNNALIQAISAGEIDLAITNHYYLFRYLDNNPDYPVNQTFFDEGDPGNLINVAGVGITQNSRNNDAAEQFASFLLTEDSQNWFVKQTFEYPVIEGIETSPDNASLEDIEGINPRINLDELEDLDATLKLLREVGLL